jgi:hypothetical protein
MIEAIAIQVISIGGLALGGLAFGLCLGFGMWASGVRMTVATVERKANEVKK